MRNISRIRWTEDSIEHISRHRVHPEEVEEVCLGEQPFIQSGRGGLHYVFGRTQNGRHLFVVVRDLRRGEVMVVTARDMDTKERSYYRRRGK